MLHSLNQHVWLGGKGSAHALLASFLFLALACGADRHHSPQQEANLVVSTSIDTQAAVMAVTEAGVKGGAEKFAEGAQMKPDSMVVPGKNDLLGKLNPVTHSDFTLLPGKWASGQLYLRKEAAAALVRMCTEAARQGIDLKVISAMRTFDHQKGIWNRKWNERKSKIPKPAELSRNILLYSAMPGCSRHHWGTDVDLNSLTPGDFVANGKHSKTYSWLVDNAGAFGFCQVYSARSTGRTTGYEEERWHWSYLPIASTYLTAYLAQITFEDLEGFEGAATARELNVIQHYVAGISEACKAGK